MTKSNNIKNDATNNTSTTSCTSMIIVNKNLNRNTGLDLLRILAIFMVVTLHVVGQGGMLSSATHFSLNESILRIIEIVCLVCNNLYALITGYLYVNSKYKISKIVQLWLRVFFYSAGITLFFYIFMHYDVSIKELVKALFPTLAGTFWYFSTYFVLFIFIPFINEMIHHLSKKQYKNLLFISISFLSIAWVGRIFDADAFTINNGFSPLWIIIMYMIGAYISLYKDDFIKYKSKNHLLLYIVSILTTFILNCLLVLFKKKLFNQYGGGYFLITSINPLIIFASIQLFLFFSKLKITKGNKLIAKVSSLAFGVYLIHEQPIMRKFLIDNRFSSVASESWYMVIIKTLLISIGIYTLCTLINFIVEFIFKKLKIDSLCEKAINFVKNFFKRITSKYIQE